MKYGRILEATDLDGLPVKPGDNIAWTTRRRHPDGGTSRTGGPLMQQVTVEGQVSEVSLRKRPGHPMQYDVDIYARPDGETGEEMLHLSDIVEGAAI